MTLPNPKFAPRRSDLPWLRRRRKPPAAAVAPPAEAAPAKAAPAKAAPPAKAPPAKAAPVKAAPISTTRPTSGSKIDYTRRDRTPPTPARSPEPTPPRREPAPPRPARTPPTPAPDRTPAPAASSDNALDLSAPTPSPAPPSRPPAPASRPPAPASSSSGNALDLSAPTPAPPTPAPASSGASTSLDLGGGSPAPAPTASSSTSLDLGGGAPPPGPAPSGPTTSLDLGAGGASGAGAAGGSGATRPTSTRRPAPSPSKPERHHVVRRTRSGATTLLDFGNPVVTLDRVQSGVGLLTLDAVVGDEVGDLRIGAAWALTDGRSGTVELDAGRRHGPDNRRPVVWAQKEGRFERIALDLRQSPLLARLLVYGFSPSKQSLTWGGTVVVTTYGGDRVDAPIVSAPSPAVVALVSVYNVDGEFVVRSEMDPVTGSVRDTCRAFGYDRITWLDDRTPVV